MPALRLTDRELVVAVALAEAPGRTLLARPDAQERLASLRRAGVVGADGALEPDAAATLLVVARAIVRVDLRRSFGDAIVELRTWADESDAVTGRVEGDTLELRRAPREALPSALVRAAGLADGHGPKDGDRRAPLPVSAAALLAARDHLRTGDRGAAIAALDRAGEDLDAALAVADTLRLAFVAQGSWRERDGEWHPGTVAALDAGAAGWWSFDPGAEDDAVRPTDAHALSARLVGLLP
jgi:hypothetical protein